MKFILLTNPTLEHDVLYELIRSGLRPKAIVTDSPFHVKKTNFVKVFLKKIFLLLKYLKNRNTIKNRYKAYFLAKKHAIPYYNSAYVNSKGFELKVKSMKIEYIFTFGFKILKENIINAPIQGCINFHPAYLPSNRGATPSKWVLIKGQKETGFTFHYINTGIDKGDIIEQVKIVLSGYETTEILNKYLFNLGALFLVKLIYRIKSGQEIISTHNPIELGSYEPSFKRENSIISEERTFDEICNIIKASRDGNKYASYDYKGENLEVVNYLDIHPVNKALPFHEKNNLFIKTKDNKQIMLITASK